jgi:hypothetical protein
LAHRHHRHLRGARRRVCREGVRTGPYAYETPFLLACRLSVCPFSSLHTDGWEAFQCEAWHCVEQYVIILHPERRELCQIKVTTTTTTSQGCTK